MWVCYIIIHTCVTLEEQDQRYHECSNRAIELARKVVRMLHHSVLVKGGLFTVL